MTSRQRITAAARAAGWGYSRNPRPYPDGATRVVHARANELIIVYYTRQGMLYQVEHHVNGREVADTPHSGRVAWVLARMNAPRREETGS